MKLLIAGFGDLGRTLAQTCQVTAKWEQASILAIKRQPPAQSQPSSDQIAWLKADLSDPDSLNKIASQIEDVTHIVYCAAPNERSEGAYRATYLTGLQNLVMLFKARVSAPITSELTKTGRTNTHRLPQLLFVSSTAVYDSQAQGRFDESSATEPRRFNGKLLLEAESWLLANWSGALVLRLSGIYGPSKQGLLSSIANGTTTLPASPHYIANRIHIEDAARAILYLFDHHHEGIFIGTDSHPMALDDLYRQLAKMLKAAEPALGEPSPMMGKKQLSNQKLLSTGFELKWPDCIRGYEALIGQNK